MFRFPKREEVEERVKREARLLTYLSIQNQSLPLPIYQLHYAEEQLLCVSYAYLEGSPLRTEQSEIANVLGAFLSELHGMDITTAEAMGFTYERNGVYWERFYGELNSKLYPHFSQKQQDFVDRIFKTFLEKDGQKHSKKLVHGDLTSSNLLYDQEGGRLTGIIDFTDAMIGDPAIDIAGFYWDFGPEFTRLVLDHYEGNEPREAIYQRVEQFFGIQPLFFQLLHRYDNEQPLDQSEAMIRLAQLTRNKPNPY
ncbi:kanamycin kinase [Bacillus sp. JCM 19046]|nr:kanamycin kinase [Bacillus sp. JCM 19045]GAF18227.1 kanamycin kinase [Bacillus sp. JCM 19046]